MNSTGHPHDGSPISRIMVAVDRSEESTRAANFALELARALGSEVIFGAAVFVPVVETMPYPEAQEEKLLKQARERLDAWEARAAKYGVKTRSIVREGDPASTLARLAEEEGVDLIVAGTHGRRGVRRLLLGSVAEGVARQAPCPVLLVRRKQRS